MGQCSLGSFLQAKSCSTCVFWAERLLASNHTQIISDAQIICVDVTGEAAASGHPMAIRLLVCLQVGGMGSRAGTGSSRSLLQPQLQRALLGKGSFASPIF